MQKNIFTLVILILILLGGWWWVQTNQDQGKTSDTMMQDQQSEDETIMENSEDVNDEALMMDEKTAPEEAMMQEQTTARYVTYSTDVFEQSSDKRRVLFFYANWCPVCQPADKSFSAYIDQVPEDVVLIRVNYNDSDTDSSEKQLANTYGITYQHTFVQVDKDGKQITSWNGGQLPELLKNLK